MRFFSPTISATIATILLAACSSNGGSPSALLPSAGGNARFVSLTPLIRQSARLFKPATTFQNLYVANGNNFKVTVYDHAGNYLYAISNGIDDPMALVFDASENLYVPNFGSWAVTVYAKGKTAPFRTIRSGINQPVSAGIGNGGDLYVANSNNTVTIYNPSGNLIQTLNLANPNGFAFDSTGVVYVGNAGSPGSVTVCTGAPPNTKCSQKLKENIDFPNGLAVDSSNNLYVANGDGDSVTECSATFHNCSTQWGVGDLDIPHALAFDSLGHLCVASYGNNKVLCFSSPTTIAWSLDASDGINQPVSLAVGPSSGWLRVANSYSPKGSVTQYCPGCTKPNRKITTNIDEPWAIAIGP